MTIKEVIREINHGKNLERNIPRYLNELMTIHNNAANYAMTFHYYTFIEMLQETDCSDIEGFITGVEVINECIATCFKEGVSVEELNGCVKQLDNLRDDIIAKMKVLTAYTDVFQIHEYIINRLEGKYSIKRYVADDEEFATRIMEYIFAEQDRVTVNTKIQEMVGQLPVRMTKTRFLDLVNDSLSIYQGSDKSSLDTFLYMTRTGATLDRPDGYDTMYSQLVTYKNTLDGADYKNLSMEEYVDMKLTLEKAVNFIEHTAEAYYTMQEVVNDLYTILLTAPYANMPGTIDKFQGDMPLCATVITNVKKAYEQKTNVIPYSLTSLLSQLEGKQERLMEFRSVAESIFFDLEMNHVKRVEELMLLPQMHCLDRAIKLQSNSIFVELDREAILGVVDETHMAEVRAALMKELNEVLSASSQVLSRAIMGNVLSKLPVFFQNQNEIKDYVYHSLVSCKDEAEKSACIQLIQQIIA